MSHRAIPYVGRLTNGKQATIPVPVEQPDGSNQNLDGLALTATLERPDGTTTTPTSVTQRASGSHLADVVHTWDQAGTWLLELYVAGEVAERYRLDVGKALGA